MIVPRLLVVDSVSTNVQENTQNLGLDLLDRTASAEFPEIVLEKNLTKIIEYARQHAQTWLDENNPYASFRHKPNLQVPGNSYHLGNVLTEQQAFDLGYVEPRIDTLACRIVDTAVTRKVSAHPSGDKELTRALRDADLITADYSALTTPARLHVFANHLVDTFSHRDYSEANHYGIGKGHPIDLMLFPPERGILNIGVMGFCIQPQNRNFEFMTSIPA